MVKLIALDLDGTLLTPSGLVTDAARSAIAQARATGVRVVVSTGRAIQEAAWFARETGCDCLCCALGGGALVDAAAGRVIRRWDVEEPSGRRALELCLGRGIELIVFAGEQIVLDPFSKKRLEKSYPFPVFHTAAVVTEDPAAYLEEHGLPLTKLHGDGKPGEYPLEELSALPGVQITTSTPTDFELVSAAADKGRTLATLALLYGIPLDQCAAVGDSENDLPMLRSVGTAIAMGNAPGQVKAAADRIVASNAQDGAAQAILSCL